MITRVKAVDQRFSPEDRVTAVVQHVFEVRSINRPVALDDDLVLFGLTSLDTVKIVLLVESEFELMIPTADIIPANFRSISTISVLVRKLKDDL